MRQTSWLEELEEKDERKSKPPSRSARQDIVNVASVPQRSPFRYPGGKTWFVPKIRAWLNSLPSRPTEFVEPFVGGGIISLTVAFENLAGLVTMVELDPQVAAVWKTMLGEDAEWLANQIVSFDMTPETLDAALVRKALSTRELAFQTILRNRTYRGGILAPGAGRIKYGEKGKGILSRWYPLTISKRIRAVAQPSVRGHIRFIEGDGLEVVQQKATSPTTVFFIDPPYTASSKKAGQRLYTHSELDHERLFYIASTFVGDFLMTYDNDEEVHKLAIRYGFDTELVAMKSTHHAEMTELLIGRNLDWMRAEFTDGA